PDGVTTVPETQVQVHSADYSFFASTSSNASGVYRLSVPAGSYVLTAEPPFGSTSYARSANVDVVVGADGSIVSPTSPVNVRLTTPNVAGRVLEAGGAAGAVPNARVQVRTQNYSYMTDTFSDSDGAYRLSVPPGTYALTADPPFGSSQFGRSAGIALTVAPDGTVASPPSLDVRLTTPNVSGTVLEPGVSTGAVPNARVQVR